MGSPRKLTDLVTEEELLKLAQEHCWHDAPQDFTYSESDMMCMAYDTINLLEQRLKAKAKKKKVKK